MMQIFKTGTYNKENSKIRPRSSKAVSRDNRRMKRLLSISKEGEQREN
jgi:hypothetical protein